MDGGSGGGMDGGGGGDEQDGDSLNWCGGYFSKRYLRDRA